MWSRHSTQAIAVSLTVAVSMMTSPCLAARSGGGGHGGGGHGGGGHPQRMEEPRHEQNFENRNRQEDRGRNGGERGNDGGYNRSSSDRSYNTQSQQNHLSNDPNQLRSQTTQTYSWPHSSTSGGSSGTTQNYQSTAQSRQSQVLGRDTTLNSDIQADKGNLNGHYNQLTREDQAIKNQEQFYSSLNGGHLAQGEQQRLNAEENQLARQINHDDPSGKTNSTSSTRNTNSSGTQSASNNSSKGNWNKGDSNNGSWDKGNWDKGWLASGHPDYQGSNGSRGNSGNYFHNFMPRGEYGNAFGPRGGEVMGRDLGLQNLLSADYGHLSGHFGQLESEDKGIEHQLFRDEMQNGGYLTKGEQQQLNNEENHLVSQIGQDFTGFHDPFFGGGFRGGYGGFGGGWGGTARGAQGSYGGGSASASSGHMTGPGAGNSAFSGSNGSSNSGSNNGGLTNSGIANTSATYGGGSYGGGSYGGDSYGGSSGYDYSTNAYDDGSSGGSYPADGMGAPPQNHYERP